MDDLAQWLSAQLDEDERIARAAGGDDWRRQDHPSETVAVYDSQGEPVVYDEGWPTLEQQAHIVAHDPARVLREIEAKREIIREHHRSGVNCPQCSLGTEDGEVVYQRDPCQTLRLLALPYSGRSGYDAERWAPWPIRPYPVPPWTLTDMLGIGQEPPEDDQES